MITESEIFEINITEGVLSNAKKRAKSFKSNSQTIERKLDTKIAGFVAEEIFVDNFGGELVADSNFFHDVETDIGGIDIKTKRCKSKPLINYDCSVTSYQLQKAQCDFFLFCRCNYDFTKLWICGIISTKKFREKSEFIPKGTRDGGFVCNTDMFNMKIQDLDNFMEYIL